MKKKTVYNLIMVVIIACIVLGGIGTVGYIRGWFDSADGKAVLTDIVGVVRMERAGVNYTVEKDTVLRNGDKITTQTGATAVIALGQSRVTLGGDGALTVTDTEKMQMELSAGELFANTDSRVEIHFEGTQSVTIPVENATVGISYRQGAQTVRVFRGNVGDLATGQQREYLTETTYVSKIDVASLSSFSLAQIRKANQTVSLCVSNKQLDELEEKRRQELEDMINGSTTPHEHSYQVQIVSASCEQGGYTEYYCACGHSYRENEVAAKGHRFGTWEITQPATPTEKGWKQHKCSVCGQVKKEQIDYFGEDHVHDYEKTTVEPTCMAEGYTQYSCACGDSYRTDIVGAKGHAYQRRVYEPTCTAEGYTVYSCACGDSYKDKQSVVDALGHSWGSWVTVNEATENENGLKKRCCSRCEEVQEVVIPMTSQTNFVYLTIRCDTILNNLGDLKPGKAEFVPENGVILPTVKVSFNPGETVFDILQRICMQMDIQMEYSWSPMYGTNYIEGINNLYEFDCGGESGWMYKVNEWFPNYGVSAYKVSNGDNIVFAYTCKGLGTDVGAPEWEGNG